MTTEQLETLHARRARARRLTQLRALGYDPDVLTEAQLERVLGSMVAREVQRLRVGDDLAGWRALRVFA